MQQIPQYHVEAYKTGFFSGASKTGAVTQRLNQMAGEGWTLKNTFKDETRFLFFFKRESVFFIMERNGDSKETVLLRQFLRSYQLEPEA
ncbi:MAG: DUF4177 domain-containing protein [Verrucomicrobiota bacterium]